MWDDNKIRRILIYFKMFGLAPDIVLVTISSHRNCLENSPENSKNLLFAGLQCCLTWTEVNNVYWECDAGCWERRQKVKRWIEQLNIWASEHLLQIAFPSFKANNKWSECVSPRIDFHTSKLETQRYFYRKKK